MRPAPETVARFRRDVEYFDGGPPERLGVAVSGGYDSLALLLLAHAALPGCVEAATVDHGLRPESRDEALYVGEICAGLDCPHAILPVAVPDGPAGLQAEARRVRSDALAHWAADLGVAVSGCSHGVALVRRAHAVLPGWVEAATVDHVLRPESLDEALYVGEICAVLDCPHAILPVAVPNGPAGLQAEARRVRYDALAHWAAERGIGAIATAHHADDQAETLLMRLQRGSGIAGLSGIRAIRHEGDLAIVRPLLGWTKADRKSTRLNSSH